MISLLFKVRIETVIYKSMHFVLMLCNLAGRVHVVGGVGGRRLECVAADGSGTRRPDQ